MFKFKKPPALRGGPNFAITIENASIRNFQYQTGGLQKLVKIQELQEISRGCASLLIESYLTFKLLQ